MKNPVHIDLIREYILQKPGRPFEEVKLYSASIGASEEDLKEAIFQVSEVMLNINPHEFQPEEPVKKLSKKARALAAAKQAARSYSIIISAATFAVLGIILLNTIPHNSHALLTSTSPATGFNSFAEGILGIEPIYAHQGKIDVSQVFSVPSSNVSLHFTGKPQKEILGFFPYWMIDQQEKVHLESVTSLALFGLDVDSRGNISIKYTNGAVSEGWQMWKNPKLDDLITRARRRNIKLYITLKSFDNSTIQTLTTSDAAQKQMIANAVELVKIKSLNGINIDFEYFGDSNIKYRNGFSRLIANLSSELKRQVPGARLSVDTFLTSASTNQDIFDIQTLAKSLDTFVIMGYDVHTPSGAPGPVAPMEGMTGIIGNLESYLTRADGKQLILGVAYYGYDWVDNTTDTSQNHGIPYAQIAFDSLKSKLQWDPIAESPYYKYVSSGKTHEVHFENSQSLGLKYDYVNRKNLAGVALWAMGYDGDNTELNQLLIDKFNE